MQNKPAKLINTISTIKKEVNNSINWVNDFLIGQQKEKARYNLIKIRRKLNTIDNALNYNASAALYGESQVGKSYLVKNLLSDLNGKFLVQDIGQNIYYDYLEEINPKGGGVEATSLVTRFTTNTDIINQDYPIKINILSPKDVTLFLIDSCLSELKKSLLPFKTEQIKNIVKELVKEYGSRQDVQSFFNEDDIYNIKDYLENHFKFEVLTNNLNDADFWNDISYIIKKINYDEWYKVCQIFWANNSSINEIFNRQIKGLQRLQFSLFAFIKFKAVLRKHGTLIDVERLHSLNLNGQEDPMTGVSEPLHEVEVFFPETNATIKVEKNILCALISELVFKLDAKLANDKTFLNNTDLLDFPGARSREAIEDYAIAESVSSMILRGKVAYLFNKYSSEYLISNLLFCNKSAQVDVTYLPSLLNTWISNFIGQNRKERQDLLNNSKIAPLFMIYTWFNNDLGYDSTNDKSKSDLDQKWHKRFIRIFKKGLVTDSYNWDVNWAEKEFFNNNYMLRDPKYSGNDVSGANNIFKIVQSKEIENVVPENYPNYWKDLKDTFINYEFVKKHFENPELTWQESATPNQDGTIPIIRNLTKAGEVNIRKSKLINETVKAYKAFITETTSHYHSDEADKLIINAQNKAGEIELEFSTAIRNDRYVFGKLIRNLIVSEREAFNFYHDEIDNIETLEKKDKESYTAILLRVPEINNSKTFDENVEALRKNYHFESTEETIQKFKEKNIDLEDLFFGNTKRIKKNSEILANGFVDYWLINFLNIERFTDILNSNISEKSLLNLFDNIKASFKKIDIKEKVAKAIRKYVDRYDKVDTVQFMISDISACIINNFINTMGYCYLSDEVLETLKDTNEENKLGLHFDHSFLEFSELEQDQLVDLFNTTDNLESILNEIPIDRDKIKNISNESQFYKWNNLMRISFVSSCNIPTYDVLANNQLGKIIEDTNNIKVDNLL